MIFRCSAPPAAAHEPTAPATNPPPKPCCAKSAPTNSTPREALDLLYRLKALVAG